MTGETSVPPVAKSATAFRTIGKVAIELGVPQHVLRYWEGRFPQLKPLQRAGNRRLYRPADVDLARRINTLLNTQGYSIRGVQQLLADGVTTATATVTADASADPIVNTISTHQSELIAIRDLLTRAMGPVPLQEQTSIDHGSAATKVAV